MSDPQSLGALADRVIDALRDGDLTFRQMAELAKLDPALDFVGADLAHVDFRDEDLAGFNFNFADISHCDFTGANLSGCSFHGAVRTGAIGLPLLVDEVSLEELEALLSDQDAEVREAAIELAVSLGPSDAVGKLLLRSTKDPFGKIRTQSYAALARLARHLPRLKDEIRNGFKDESEAVRRAAVALFDGDLSQTMRDALLQQHADVRHASAVQIAEAHGRDPELLEQLAGAATDTFWFVRRSVCEIIGRLNYDPRLIEILRLLLGDRDGHVQIASIAALAKFGDQAVARRALVRALSHSNPDIRAAAVVELADHFDDPEVSAHFNNPLSDPDYRVRVAAMRAFSTHVGRPEAKATILKAMSDPIEEVRLAALEALERHQDGNVYFETLRAALRDKSRNIRVFAIQAIARMRSIPAARASLRGLVHDPDYDVAFQATRGLVMFAGPDLGPDLGEALAHGRQREAIIEALSNFLDKRVVRSVLVTALLKFDAVAEKILPLVAREAPNHPDFRDATLSTLVLAPQTSMQASAARALAPLSDLPHIREALMETVAASNRAVATAAVDALAGVARMPEVRVVLGNRFDMEVDVAGREAASLKVSLVNVLGAAPPSPGMPARVAELFETSANAADATLRAACVKTLGRWGGAHAIKVAIRALHDDADAVVRNAIIALLGELGRQDVVIAVLPLLKGRASGRRVMAIQALATVSALPEIRAALKPLINDENVPVRVAAIQALRGGSEQGLALRLLSNASMGRTHS